MKILDALKAGITRNAAIEAAGLSRSTFYRWIQRGSRAKRGPFWDFWDRIKRAEADAEIRNVLTIQRAAQGGQLVSKITVIKPDGTVIVRERQAVPEWRAATWWLERKYPNIWGRRDRVDDGNPDGPLIRKNGLVQDRSQRAMDGRAHALAE